MSINQLTNLSKNLRLTSIILIIGISLSLFILSCGSGIGPQEKVNNPERGQFAVDFGQAPGNTGTINLAQSMHSLFPNSEPGFTGEFTVEAWVKKNAGSLPNGVIFSRASDASGIMLYYTSRNYLSSELRFAMLKRGVTQPYVLRSGSALVEDAWTHVAVVLVNEDHTTVHVECGETLDAGGPPFPDDTGARAQTPHLDMYIDGSFVECAATECTLGVAYPATGAKACAASGSGNFSDALTTDINDLEMNEEIGHSQMFILNPAGVWWATGMWYLDGSLWGFNTKTNAAIDEVRFWGVARSSAQVNECMNKELSVSGGGNCNIDHSKLKGYWKFNEGQGSGTADHSGSGGSGTKNWCLTDCGNAATVYEEWTGGWAAGYPF